MSETQTVSVVSATPLNSKIDVQKLSQDLASAVLSIQSLIDHPDSRSIESIRYIPSLLKQAQQTVLEAEAWRQLSEATSKETQQLIQGANEMQTLLDILPVGIVIAHDPQNQKMTINRAGQEMLNLAPETNPSKSAPGGDQLPFKCLRNGMEIPAEELPMQYATTHRVALRDIEMDVQHSTGKLHNLLEYASPLYDENGSVRGSVGVLVDITGRRSIEQRLMMQYNIARVLAESNSVNKAASLVLQMFCQTVGWEYGALWRVDTDSSTLINEGVWHTDDVDLSEHATAIRYSVLLGDDTSLPGVVLHSGQPLWLPSLEDIQTEDAIDAGNAGLQCAFLLPVRSGNRIIAILECASTRRQIQDQNIIAMLNAVGNQIGIFLERKLLEEALAVRANQQHLLAQAGMAMSTSLDYEQRLLTIVHVIVPDLADWCAIDVIDQNQMVRRVAAAHVDPSKEKLVYEVQPTRPVDINPENSPQVRTLLTGQTLLFTDISFSMIENTVTDAAQLEMFRRLDPISSIVVPLIAHNQILGICTFVQSDSRRHYISSDLALAEDIARQAALALDNSLVFAESQKLNAELESRVEERTAQLKLAIDQLTNQIAERQLAEDQVRILNSELELRIAERTAQLEIANRDLQKEVLDRQKASQTLSILLRRTRESYRISQTIGTLRTPNELLKTLLSSTYLKDASRASIALLNRPWIMDEAPPEQCRILAEWNRNHSQPNFLNEQFTLEEYGVVLPVPYGQPIVIADIQSVKKLPETVRKRFADLRTHSLIILPLFAGGELYGLLSLHFKTRRMTNPDDLRHVRGLVDKTAVAIKNVRLLEAESQARREAEMANEVKLKFLAMISHELRTPLASIKGFTTTLLSDDVVWPPDKQRDFLEIINGESDNLTDLIEQLLDLTRMEAGTLRILAKKVFLKSIIDSALPQLRALTTGHELELDIPSDLPPLFGDGQRIAQVLTNLVGNSARFAPAGTRITLSAHQSGLTIQVDVADLGPGIPAADRQSVFEAFRQLVNETGAHTKGAGLGLAICKGLVEAHGGRIWIQDQIGPGTVISFTVPVWDDTKRE